MKQHVIILVRGGQKEYQTTLWLEYEPDFMFYDDGVYRLDHMNTATNTLTYEYEGNALAIS